MARRNFAVKGLPRARRLRPLGPTYNYYQSVILVVSFNSVIFFLFLFLIAQGICFYVNKLSFVYKNILIANYINLQFITRFKRTKLLKGFLYFII